MQSRTKIVTGDFSLKQSSQTKRQWAIIFKVLKEKEKKTINTEFLNQQKYLSEMNGKQTLSQTYTITI